MSAPELGLFDPREYETDPRLQIPAMLGKTHGEFFNLSRFVTLLLDTYPVDVFRPSERPSSYDAGDYGVEDSNFSGDFKYWHPGIREFESYSGYLVGFPLIQDRETGNPIRALHVWENNSSVFDETIALPLLALKSLVVHSKLETDLRVDRDEVAMGDVDSRFEIPMLREAATGEIHYRRATMDDLEQAIDDLDEPAVRVYGEYFQVPRQVIRIDDCTHILD